MKIYLDNCCYGRPSDNQRYARISSEAEAIKGIIRIYHTDGHSIVGSPMIDFEIQQNSDAEGRAATWKRYQEAINDYIVPSAEKLKRAKVFQAAGLGRKDAYHLAAAEAAGVDVLITVDDDFERIATNKNLSNVRVVNPLTFLLEVFQ